MSDAWDDMGLGGHRAAIRGAPRPTNPLEVLLSLHDYAALPAVMGGQLPAEVAALTAAGRALMELDLYGQDVEGLPPDLAADMRALAWPAAAASHPRGPLHDLVPVFRHLLEVMQILVTRGDTTGTLSSIHLAVEYLPLLAWQRATGHAGDPLLMTSLTRPDTAWHGSECPLDRADRQAFTSAVQAAVDPAQWDGYLRDGHSRVAAALTVCGGVPQPASRDSSRTVCRAPCGVAAGLDLGWPMLLIRRLRDSPLLQLRHDSPVGHFFAVPDAAELRQAWSRTVEGLRADHLEAPAAANPLGALQHGLPMVFAAIAGRAEPLPAGDLLARVAQRIRSGLAAG